MRRTDNQANKREEFDYDGLYRMTQSRLYATSGGTTPSATDNFTYDSLGNLTNKGGAAGAYTYANYNYGTRTGCADTVVRPHAVYQVTVGTATRRYCYDANGNLTTQSIASGSGTTKYDSSTWWVANLVKRISQNLGSSYSDFWYGPGRERIRQFAQKSATTTENTLYVGGLYEKTTRTVSGTPTTEYVHYIRGGNGAVAVVKRLSGSLQTRYLHRDHLGSVVALTDSTGAVVERYSYDPWGKRRDPSTWVTPAPGTFSFDPTYSDRGYTGHEHLDHLGLVNMNGRIYDPELGKFLSADPTTQFPESTQGWNRYSYCGNNPLSYTDPSGFSFLKSLMKLVGIVMSVFAPQFTLLWQQMLWSFAAGFLSSGGNLQGGLIAMATLGVGKWAGNFARAGPAASSATPNFNPNLLSLGETAVEQGVERSTFDKFMEVVRRSIQNRIWDSSGRTNADRKMDNGASANSFNQLYKATGQTWNPATEQNSPDVSEGRAVLHVERLYTTQATTLSKWTFTIDGTILASGWGIEPSGTFRGDRVADGTYSLEVRPATKGVTVNGKRIGLFLVDPVADATGREMTNVLIHSGNSYVDTKACYVPGGRIDNRLQRIVGGTSRPAVRSIYDLFFDDKVRTREIVFSSAPN